MSAKIALLSGRKWRYSYQFQPYLAHLCNTRDWYEYARFTLSFSCRSPFLCVVSLSCLLSCPKLELLGCVKLSQVVTIILRWKPCRLMAPYQHRYPCFEYLHINGSDKATSAYVDSPTLSHDHGRPSSAQFGPLRLPSNKMTSSEHRVLGQERIEQLWQPSKQVFHDNQVLSFA